MVKAMVFTRLASLGESYRWGEYGRYLPYYRLPLKNCFGMSQFCWTCVSCLVFWAIVHAVYELDLGWYNMFKWFKSAKSM
jgi:hypothetical protein